ncbi:transcriptional regulator FilR1 domain-containing protein [Methanolobus tindarius]|uniref:transcriptional regulator FilR1 domain-containing protein n=1 Tax=Methanolobus tindarius TaxID=2221 RepID=UPI0009FD0E4F|nr:transcriptional regulator FilR1 domain-containing protein [Methanolobus tindarius]
MLNLKRTSLLPQLKSVCSLTITDNGFLLRLLFSNNEFSNKQIICMSPEGRKWGKDLYDYYERDAELITEI